MRSKVAIEVVVLSILGACGGSGTAPIGNPDAAANGSFDAASEAGIDAGEGGASDRVLCSGAGSPSFPAFDKACASDADCTVSLHQTDCCGTRAAIGFARAEADRFAADEKVCEKQ
jgi:hypothetical protein